MTLIKQMTIGFCGIGAGLAFALAGSGTAQAVPTPDLDPGDVNLSGGGLFADLSFGIPGGMSGTGGGLSDLAIGLGYTLNGFTTPGPFFETLAQDLHGLDQFMPATVEYLTEDLSLGQWAGFGGNIDAQVAGFDSGLAGGSGISGSPGDLLLSDIDRFLGIFGVHESSAGTPALANLIDTILGGAAYTLHAQTLDLGLAADAFVVDLGNLLGFVI